jgi:hypothetical protein
MLMVRAIGNYKQKAIDGTATVRRKPAVNDTFKLENPGFTLQKERR